MKSIETNSSPKIATKKLYQILSIKNKETASVNSTKISLDKDSISSLSGPIIMKNRKLKKRTQKWNKKNTQLFYHALQIYGLEFTLMAEVFPDKISKQLLRKYHKEVKTNYAIV